MRKTWSRALTELGRAAALFTCVASSGSCRFDPAYRDVPQPVVPVCSVGSLRCSGTVLETCSGDPSSPSWASSEDCQTSGRVCATSLGACATCNPAATECQGQSVLVCAADGQSWQPQQACDPSSGFACRNGGCVNLCTQASMELSNVGCEYWGADLDNADVSPSENAAAQQYAIVVSNVQPDVPVHVTVEQDDSLPGDAAHQTQVVATAVIAPLNLEVFNLGPREVDGSADGTFNTGTGTALSRHAYKVTSDFPIVSYQFNPLDNVNVFSNDASQLLPYTGLNSGEGLAYVVPSWPQTIALTSDPATNFGIDLRAFLAIVATRDNTHVHVQSTARVIPGGPFANGIPRGAGGAATPQAFEVLNLETGDFNADFTGSTIQADQPVAVFPGSEASDSPMFTVLASRSCCADHLEHQTPPLRTVGKSYVLTKMPNRTKAVIAAGANIGAVEETEYYRIVAAAAGATHVTTTLASPYDAFDLSDAGQSLVIASQTDFVLEATQPVMVLQVQSGQDAGGVPRGLPGGDPSTLFPSPREQWRSDYVLLTPDKYVFDYLVVVAPSDAHVYIDGLALDPTNSEVTPSDGLDAAERGSLTPPYWTYRYQLSYPIIDSTQSLPPPCCPASRTTPFTTCRPTSPWASSRTGSTPYVSYAYAGGTQLAILSAQ